MSDCAPQIVGDKVNPNPQPPILEYFRYKHLSPELQAISQQFCDVAEAMVATLPPSAEVSAGLRKLLEAKDCFVRAAL